MFPANAIGYLLTKARVRKEPLHRLSVTSS